MIFFQLLGLKNWKRFRWLFGSDICFQLKSHGNIEHDKSIGQTKIIKCSLGCDYSIMYYIVNNSHMFP